MNHLRSLLALLVVLGSYGLSSGQDQQITQQSQPEQGAREWIGLIPGYQQPGGVETHYGVITEVRASRKLRPGAQSNAQASVRGPDEKNLPAQFIEARSISVSSGKAYRSSETSSGAIHAPQRNPSQQAVRKIRGLEQTGVKPMAGEKLASKDAPRSFNEYGAQLFTTLVPRPEPHDLIMSCGVQGRSADVVAGRCK